MNNKLIPALTLSGILMSGCTQYSLERDLSTITRDPQTTTYAISNDCAILSSSNPNILVKINRERNRQRMLEGRREWTTSTYNGLNNERFIVIHDPRRTVEGAPSFSAEEERYLLEQGGRLLSRGSCGVVFPTDFQVSIPMLEESVKNVFDRQGLDARMRVSSNSGPLQTPFFYGFKEE